MHTSFWWENVKERDHCVEVGIDSLVKCTEVLRCNYYKTYRQQEVSVCRYCAFITYSHIFRFLFYKNMVVIYVFLLEEVMYCYSCLYVVYVFLDAATLNEVFPCFFLCCKANARV